MTQLAVPAMVGEPQTAERHHNANAICDRDSGIAGSCRRSELMGAAIERANALTSVAEVGQVARLCRLSMAGPAPD
jgi:hypothetical protein